MIQPSSLRRSVCSWDGTGVQPGVLEHTPPAICSCALPLFPVLFPSPDLSEIWGCCRDDQVVEHTTTREKRTATVTWEWACSFSPGTSREHTPAWARQESLPTSAPSGDRRPHACRRRPASPWAPAPGRAGPRPGIPRGRACAPAGPPPSLPCRRASPRPPGRASGPERRPVTERAPPLPAPAGPGRRSRAANARRAPPCAAAAWPPAPHAPPTAR